METTNEKVLAKVFEHAAAVDEYCATIDATRIFTALYGSQNYGLDDENSDVDTKSLILPSKVDWLWSTEGNCNHVLTMPDGSHAEMKPIVGMFKQYMKGNINFLEMLYTPYVDIAEGWEWVYEELIGLAADKISKHNMFRQAPVWLGYISQMMTRCNFNDETKTYDAKALMNVFRLKETFTRWFKFHRPFDEAIDLSDRRTELLGIKKGAVPYDVAKTFVQNMEYWIEDQKKYILDNYTNKETFNAEYYLRSMALEIFEHQDAIIVD